MTVNADIFLSTIFDGLEPDEHILLACQIDGDYFTAAPWSKQQVSQWQRGRKAGGIYFNVSTVKAPEGDDPWRRRKQDCICAYVIVLDDIGTKVSEQPPVEPSYKMETSKGNYQWGYLIEPYDNLGRYEAIVEALGELGFTDKGAGGYNRLMRIPGSVNTKEGKGNFISTVTEWEPKRIFELEQLATDLGVDLNNLGVKKQPTASRANGSLPDIEILDEMETWLRDNGHVIDDTGGEFVTIKCPWADQHTTGKDTAGYSPLGRGTGEWVERRAFNCFHSCEKGFKDFREWAVAQGGPDVRGVDPLPWLQDRYYYVIRGQKVADMYMRPNGGDCWPLDLEDFSKGNLRFIPVPGRDRQVLLKTAFLESPNTKKFDTFAYVPGAEATTTFHGHSIVNTYIEVTHPETDQEPEIFLEHMEFLLGDQKDFFIDWLAHKIQYPAQRSFAIVMVAEDSYGVGRSWIRSMLDQVLMGKVETATLGQLIGKGTSGERNFNDWGSSCQFLIIEEAKDVEPVDFYNGYEVFKQRVDTRPVKFRVNPKYGKTRNDFMYFNCLIFTNHSDAMSIPQRDRRICVLSNPSDKREPDYYERLERTLDTNEEAQKIYWHLKRRDVSKFERVYPPETEAKARMVEQSQGPIEEITELALGNIKGDIVTKDVLSRYIRQAARKLNYGKIESESGNVVGRLWRRLGKLRLDAKNGARYTIDNTQDEVRAVRNREKWMAVDRDRDQEKFAAELKLNMEGDANAIIFPK